MNRLKFEWDKKKDKSNTKKHSVSFAKAQAVFYDEVVMRLDCDLVD